MVTGSLASIHPARGDFDNLVGEEDVDRFYDRVDLKDLVRVMQACDELLVMVKEWRQQGAIRVGLLRFNDESHTSLLGYKIAFTLEYILIEAIMPVIAEYELMIAKESSLNTYLRAKLKQKYLKMCFSDILQKCHAR